MKSGNKNKNRIFESLRLAKVVIIWCLTATLASGCGGETKSVEDEKLAASGETGSTSYQYVSGGKSDQNAKVESQRVEEEKLYGNNSSTAEVSTIKQEKTETTAKNTRAAIGLTEDGIEKIQAAQVGLYAYEHLSSGGQHIYAEIYAILKNHAVNIQVSTKSEEIVDTVYKFVMADHPEIFYTTGYELKKKMADGEITALLFSGSYLYGEDEEAKRQEQIDAYVAKCRAGMPQGDDYEKAKYVYEYIIRNTEYNYEAVDSQNICSVFINGKSACNGYAKATQYILNLEGIEATLVIGNAGGVGHAWVLANIDGSYTYIDTTWGDASYKVASADGTTSKDAVMINHSYLCVTTAELEKTHTLSGTVPMPECTDTSCNYYIREHEYFDKVDVMQVAMLFDKKYKEGADSVTIKCSDKATYEGMIDKMLVEQEIFGFVKNADDDGVSYVCLDDQLMIVVWI